MTKLEDKTKTVKKTTKKSDKETSKAVKTKVNSKETDLSALSKKVEALQKVSLPQMRDSIISAVLSIFEQTSFIEEAEEIKYFVNAKINEIKRSLGQVPTGIDENSYTLDEMESDMAKLRLSLDKFIENNRHDEISDILEKISQVEVVLESLQNFIGQMQINELRANVEKVNEDVLSVSSRINGLLLNRDELNESIKNLERNIIDKKKSTEQIVKKIDDISKTVKKNIQLEESTRQALTYLGEWIDGTGSEISKISEIKDSLEELNDKCPDSSKLLNYISERFAAQDDKLASIEAHLAQLSRSVEKLTSYVD